MTKIIEKDLSYRIVGILYKIHQELGRFCREKQYGDVLENKLKEEKIKFIREWPIELAGRKSNFVDFFIEDKILIDLKAKSFINKDDYYQMKRYLEISNKELGLLVNFRQPHLKPKRVLNSQYSGHSDKFADSDYVAGVASLPVILSMMILILAVGIGVTSVGLTESIISAGHKQSSEALLFAEAGARDALMRISRGKNFNSASYQINFAPNGCLNYAGCATISVSSAISPKVIISEGRAKSSIRKVQVNVFFDALQNGEIADIQWQEITD